MARFLLFAIAFAAVSCFVPPPGSGSSSSSSSSAGGNGGLPPVTMRQQFNAFKQQHERVYADAAEERKRFRIFASNMHKASELQRRNPNAVFGVTPFADLSAEEFAATRLAPKRVNKAKIVPDPKDVPLPQREISRDASGEKINWVTLGAVTPVLNQGQCGSDWAFSLVSNIEGQWFLAGHPLTPLSVEEIIECDSYDNGCNGGSFTAAVKWILEKQDGWLASAESYPYNSSGSGMSCNISAINRAARITGYWNLPQSEEVLANVTYNQGPVSVAVDATSWQTYVSGVMTDCISQQLDHEVLVVGFDETANPPYWILKNSWGTFWGENGYIRIAMGSNQCLIADDAQMTIAAK